jgi:glycine cleavage system regulatory protein/folate-dependent phosphoribosylglycinamide formyltransferase PurN
MSTPSLRVALCGSRYFGASVFDALRQLPGVQIAGVVTPAADDRLANAARPAGVPVHVQTNPKIIGGEAIPDGCDLIVAAHTHARINDDALAKARLGGVGYHPSLLPRHRGIAAVEWTILCGDPIAGGSVYHLADGWDAGPLAAQDWCFVGRDDTARTLWERELAPMGLRLLQQVVTHAATQGSLPAHAQNTAYATKAPMLRRSVVVADDAAGRDEASIVLTIMGPDRPGIVSQVADRAQRFGANWTDSFMANLGGEFAGIVQLQVARAQKEALNQALLELQSTGLRIVTAQRDMAATAPRRGVSVELVGADRPGIVSELASALAARQISIEHLVTECVTEDTGAQPRFKVRAQLQVPAAVPLEDLQGVLDGLSRRLLLDVALG